MVCRCDEIRELWDADAKAYAEKHLEQVESKAGGWEVVYRCPESDHRWLEAYPRGEEHGGGPLHLRRLD